MLNDWFDNYSRQARLAPALLSLFPGILVVALQFPSLYQTAAGLVGLALVCGVLTLASHFARTRGKNEEKRLIAKWGGKPTTLFLTNKDKHLDQRTLDRYLAFFSEKIPHWKLGEDSESDLESAVRWLLERTRDTSVYGLIFKENISYGFRRNCLGMKPIGLAVALATLLYWGIQLYLQRQIGPYISPVSIGGLGVSLIMSIWWALVVSDDWVKEAGNSYAKALLGSIDTMS